ncbi:hypothetical protein DBR45_45760 [Pseudomonas sp. HMWF031]|nr:hypothetical protein DBR45_45760 [Pseudomonas sp. HMWF031]
MHDNSEANITTADALTLLLHNQHAICAAIEEITKWLSENGVGNVAANATAAMETLDRNALAVSDADYAPAAVVGDYLPLHDERVPI